MRVSGNWAGLPVKLAFAGVFCIVAGANAAAANSDDQANQSLGKTATQSPAALAVQLAQAEVFSIDIPAQPLSDALRALGRQTGLQFFARSELTQGLTAPAVSGRMSADEALRRLLDGSGLTYRYSGSDVVALERNRAQPESGPIRLGPVTVEAVLEGTTTDSYAAPDSFSATRTDTPLIDTPQSAQSVTRQALEDAGATTIADSYDYLAGINQENNTGGLFGDDYIARGFATDNILFNGNRTGQPTTLDTANVERIEALRGPTATLFGRADPGGLINVITKQPLSEPLYQLDLSGSTGLIDDGSRLRGGRATFDAGGPIDEEKRVRYRFNSAVDYERSFRQDVEEKVVFLAPVIEAELDDRTVANLEFAYQFREDSFDRGVFFIDGGLPLDRDFNFADGQNPTTDKHYASASLRLDHEFTDNWKARFGFYSSFNEFEGEGIQVGSVAGSQVTLQRRFNEGTDTFVTAQPEIVGEFATGPIGHTLLMGLDASYQINDVDLRFGQQSTAFDALNPVFPDVPELADVEASRFKRDLTASSLGAYVQDQIDLTDQWKLLLGLRWDAVWLTEETLFTLNNGTFSLSDRDEDFQGSALLPRAGIVYQPIPEIGIYTSYSETYRPPTAGGLTDIDGNEVDPEEARNFEVGIKLDALDGKLSGTLAAFRSDKRNVLESDPVDFFANVNLGNVRSEGVEFDLAGDVTENISLGVSYAYTNARISSNDGSLPKGTRLRNVPLHAASFHGAYRFTEGMFDGLRLFGGVVYESENKTDTSQVVRTELPSYVRVDLRASYKVFENVEASLLIRNLTDKEYYTSAAGQNNVAVGDPLSVTFGLRMKF